MADAIEYNPTKHVATLKASDNGEVRFYIDTYKKYKYASIRFFMDTDDYKGPTKAGVTFNGKALTQLSIAIAFLDPGDIPNEDNEKARIKKSEKDGIIIETIIRTSVYKDLPGIDIRQYQTDKDPEGYTGFLKKGLRFKYSDLQKLQECVAALFVAFSEDGKKEDKERQERSAAADADAQDEIPF